MKTEMKTVTKKKIDLENDNELLKIALSHSNVVVFEYSLIDKVLKFPAYITPPFEFPHEIEDGINFILESEILDFDDAARFKHLFTVMEQGEMAASDIFKPISEKRTWYNVMVTNCLDENGKPIRVIGTFRDVTDRVMTELRYSKEEQFGLAMLADSRRVYEINVTKDRFTALTSMKDSTDGDNWVAYTSAMDMLRREHVYRDDWKVFSEVAERDNLLYYFAKGKTEFYCEYRKVDDDGSVIWSSSTTHLLRDPITNDIKGFIYVKDIDEKKREQILLYQQAEHDPLTGIYHRGAAKKYIEEILANTQKGQIHGFLSVDIDEFKIVNDSFGHLKGDFLLQEIARGFSKLIRSQDVLARMGGDEFIIFLNDIQSITKIKSIANRLRKFVERIPFGEEIDYHSTISIGIAVFPTYGITFEELYKNSDSSLYRAKHNGKNCVSVFSE